MARFENVDGVTRQMSPARETQLNDDIVAGVISVQKRARMFKCQDFINEAVSRIAALVPEWEGEEQLKAVAGMWPALQANATADMKAAKDVYVWVKKTAIPKVNAITDEAVIRAIDVTVSDPFGDGTLWP